MAFKDWSKEAQRFQRELNAPDISPIAGMSLASKRKREQGVSLAQSYEQEQARRKTETSPTTTTRYLRRPDYGKTYISDFVEDKDADVQKAVIQSTKLDDDNQPEGNFGSLLGNTFMAGLGSFNDALASTLDLFLGQPLSALGWEDNPISKMNEYYSRAYQEYVDAALSESEKMGGGWRNTATQLGIGTVAAIPDLAIALMSGGASLAGSTSSLAAKGSGLAAKGSGSIASTLTQMARNPQYWTAFAREVGLDYEEAKAEGASELVASASAVLTSLVNAGVEIGPDITSGIQGLAEALKDGNKTRIRKVLESAVDEGKEEVLQGIVSRATSNALQGKNADWFSLDPEDQDAIINPVNMATEFGSGAAIGGLLSGGTMGADYVLRKATGQSVAPVEDVENPYAGLFTDMDSEPNTPENGPVSAEEYSQMLVDSQAETREPAPDFEAAEPVQSDVSAVEEAQPEDEIERFAKTYGKQAEAVKRTYISGQDVQAFEQGYSTAFEYGRSGATLEAARASPSVTGITEMQIEAAYGAGKSIIQAPTKKVGVVRNEYLLNASDADIEYMDALAKASGTQIEIVAPTGDGGVNGWYKDGVIKIASDAQDSYAVVASHEVTHRLKEIAPAEYRRYQDYVMQIKARNGDASALVAETQERYARADQTLSEDEAREEIAADFTRDLMRDVDRFYELVDADRGIATRLLDNLKAFLKKVKNVWNGSQAKQDAEAMKAYGVGVDALEKAAKLWGDALKSGRKQKNAAQTSSKTRYALYRSFKQEFDTWVESGGKVYPKWNRFKVGRTSDALKSIGVGDFEIIWRTGKIEKILHDYFGDVTKEVLREVPEILENPVIVMQSKTMPNRITLYGDVFGTSGVPVMAVLELRPDEKKGELQDFIVIANSYTKRGVQNLIDTSDILYLDPDKKRTTSWFEHLRLQLPSTATKYGPIRRVTYSEPDVNREKKKTPMQLAYEDAQRKTKTRFSLKEPVEETKTLIALHNLNEQKLKKVLNLGGFPMPSIAVTRTDIPHTNFGDITLVMDKSTVDPKADRKNKVYSADAWTPTVPPVEYEVDASVNRRASARLWDLGSRIDDTFYRDLSRLQDGTEDRLNRLGGEEAYIQDALDNYGLKAAYLEDQGKHIDRVTVQEEKEKGYNPDRAERYDAVLEVLGTTNPDELGRIPFKDLRDSYGEQLENIFPGMTKSVMRMSGIIRQLQAYLNEQTAGPEYETVTDIRATRKAVDDALDPDGYEQWVRDLFSGIEKGSGIYNNKDPYTPSGNRRSFGQTHYPVTLENIVKAMAGQNKGNTKNVSGFNGVKTLRAGMARRFRSIAEMHAAEGRLQNLTPEEADAVSNQLSDRMYDIIGRIIEAGPKSSRNSFMQMDSVGEVMMEIADSGKYSVENIEQVFSEYRYNIGSSLANDVRELLFDVSQMPVHLFEAKPERVVRFDEVLAAILPDDADPSLADSLRAAGISEVMTYPAGDDGARARLANSVEGARFSLKEGTEPNVRKTDADIVDEVDLDTVSDEKTRNAVQKVKPIIEAQRKAKADLDTAWTAYKTGVQSMPKAERETLKRQLDKLQAAALEAESKTNAALKSPELQKVIVTERSKIYRALLEEYGAHKPGENPAREVKVPKKTAPNEAVGRFARTAMETESAGEEFRSEMEREIASGTFSHVIESDKDAVQYAQRMKERGMAEKEWDSVVNGRVVADKNQIAVGEMLFLEAAKAGDAKRAVRLCAELCAEATRAGRTLQAVRLLKKMDGAGQLYAIERQVENLQKDLDKRLGVTKAPVLKIDENLAELLLQVKTETDRERVIDLIEADVAKQIPPSWIDKWNAWRYLAMLGNPRTHVRNVFGNAAFALLAKAPKDIIGAGLESAAQKMGFIQEAERTKSLSVDKKYRDFAKDDFKEVEAILSGDTKEGFSDAIRKKQQIFKDRALETLRVKNSKALENEDLWFKSIHYRHALAQILAARKLDVSTLTPDNPSGYAQLLSARTAALKEAERATFQDASAFAAALNRFSKTNAGTAFVTEAILPFKKTPINILKRGVEYSPIGLTTSIGKMAKQLADGDVTADVLNDFAAGLTGTMVLALGTFLASQGWLKGGYDDEREGEFDELIGGQEYALQFGDRTFTIDWAAPIALPLFVGAEVWNAINGEYENLSFSVFANALTGITEPMFNLSMLDGLNDTLSSVANADSGQELTTFAREIVTGYLGQAVPTLFGQVTRSTDTTRRRTHIDKNSEVPQWAQYFIQKQMNKIPFLSGYQQPYVDAWGREDSPENWVEAGERALENFALPGYFSSYEVSAMEKELMRVHEATGSDVFPQYAKKYFTANNKRIDLTAEQYTEYQTKLGRTSYDLMTALTQSSGYRSMNDDYKAEAISKVYTFAREKAKRMLVREYDMVENAYKYKITTGGMEDLVNKTDRTVVNAILEKTKESMERKEKEE